MGRKKEAPSWVYQESKWGDRYFPFADTLRGAQMRLQREGVLQRAYIANTFLAGPSSMLEKNDGMQAMLDHLLRDVSKENQTIAREMTQALMKSQGKMKSMSVAYILAQKTGAAGGVLTEGEMIRATFEAFGAAGVKLGQYLGFSSELGPFKKELAKLQDSALPLSYLESIRLVESRFPEGWPISAKIEGPLGSGSVNVAIEYIDQSTGETKSRVISVLRQDIEASAKNDFRKLRAFI